VMIMMITIIIDKKVARNEAEMIPKYKHIGGVKLM